MSIKTRVGKLEEAVGLGNPVVSILLVAPDDFEGDLPPNYVHASEVEAAHAELASRGARVFITLHIPPSPSQKPRPDG